MQILYSVQHTKMTTDVDSSSSSSSCSNESNNNNNNNNKKKNNSNKKKKKQTLSAGDNIFVKSARKEGTP